MLFIIFIIGILLLRRASRGLSRAELIGFALPTGLAATTLIMLSMDWGGIALSRTNLLILTLTLLAASLALNADMLRSIFKIKSIKPLHLKDKALRRTLERQRWSWINIVWVLMLMAAVYIEYVNIAKCLTYPTYDRDSMAAFDTFGYVCAREGTYIRMSLFDPNYIPSLHHAGSAMGYMPMLQLSYAYVYAFGAATSKAVPAMMYIGFLVGFYGLCRRKMTHTGAMTALLGVVMTPEMTSFASHSMTNVMHACVASAAMIYFCLWIEKQRRSELTMACVLLTINVWLRAEGIVFVAVAWAMFIARWGAEALIKRKMPKASSGKEAICRLALLLTPALPIALWAVCSKACGLSAEGTMITHPFWDGDKLLTIWNGVYGLLSSGTFYGWTFNFALLMLHLFIFDRIYLRILKRRKGTAMPNAMLTRSLAMAIMLAVAGYVLVLYHVDYQWDSIHNVLAYSAKRFIFCFVPIAWYFSLSIEPMLRAGRWLERRCGLGIVWERTRKGCLCGNKSQGKI